MLSASSPFFVTLPARGRLRVSGNDAVKFLQNLFSNDLLRLDVESSLHACLLTPQGKFLHEVFITRDGDDYLLDCEGGPRLQDLLRRLTLYKLRSQVTLAGEECEVYAVFGAAGYPDPRSAHLGARSFIKPSLPEKDFSVWDDLRIRLGIADGSRDAELEKSTLEELNMSKTAVSFTKGCYVGQELTARMEHRGLGKKHLVALEFSIQPPVSGTALKDRAGETVIGEMRSSCGSIGLALLRDDALEKIRMHDDTDPFRLLGQ